MSTPAAPAPADDVDLSHRWGIAAMVEVDPMTAKIADFRGSVKLPEATRIDALEVYCQNCRRPYDEAASDACAAKINNEHLIGGDQSVRAKRKMVALPANAVVVPGPRVNRVGMAALLRGEI